MQVASAELISCLEGWLENIQATSPRASLCTSLLHELRASLENGIQPKEVDTRLVEYFSRYFQTTIAWMFHKPQPQDVLICTFYSYFEAMAYLELHSTFISQNHVLKNKFDWGLFKDDETPHVLAQFEHLGETNSALNLEQNLKSELARVRLLACKYISSHPAACRFCPRQQGTRTMNSDRDYSLVCLSALLA